MAVSNRSPIRRHRVVLGLRRLLPSVAVASRINALKDTRRGALLGQLLARELDADLQQCVEAAARDVSAPIALVTLVLERTQFFRAHHGLPPGLAIARATDRDSSFCQFVVRDGEPFIVDDASADERVPKDLVERYGVRSYLGVPVVADGEVVGSLCVIDTVPREFSPSETAMLLALGTRASQRLQTLADARTPRTQHLIQRGMSPAFAEIRNALSPLRLAADRAQMLVAELEPAAAILGSDLGAEEKLRALDAQHSMAHHLAELREFASDIETVYERLEPAFVAIEQASSESASRVPLNELLDGGLALAHHATKLIGGFAIDTAPPKCPVRCTKALGTAIVSVAATSLVSHAMAAGLGGPLSVEVVLGADRIEILLAMPGLPTDAVSSVADELGSLAIDAANFTVEARTNAVCLQIGRVLEA